MHGEYAPSLCYATLQSTKEQFSFDTEQISPKTVFVLSAKQENLELTVGGIIYEALFSHPIAQQQK